MKGWLLIALVACGGGGSKQQTTGTGGRPTASTAGSASTVRKRVQAFCGKAYVEALPSAKGEGCDWTPIKGGRAQLSFAAEGDKILRLAVTIVTPEADAESGRTTALDLAGEMFDTGGRATVQGALRRLFIKHEQATENAGTVGTLAVHASTEIDVARPTERWIELQIEGAGTGAPLGDTAPTIASPARPVTDKWLADAKAVCTELVDAVLKSHKAAMAPANWEQGELHADCNTPDENSVARFTVTWAPGSRNVLYAYFIAELPQKKYAAFADRILTPLLTAGQWSVAKTATKKAPLDRKFEAEGLQIGSRHETGGFFGETHEIDINVQQGQTPSLKQRHSSSALRPSDVARKR